MYFINLYPSKTSFLLDINDYLQVKRQMFTISLTNRHFQNLIHAKSQKNNFSNLEQKITCENFTFFAQQKIHLCKFSSFCTTNTISYNIDNFYLLMYHRYRLNRGVLHKADREIPWYIVSRYFSFAAEIITPSNHKK